jgi:methyltransferase
MSLLHSAVYWILALVAVQRLAELVLATSNTRRLMARGAREIGRKHYPLFILLHSSWLLAIVVTTRADAAVNWWLVGLFVALQLLRVWVIATLGPYWTTRVISLEGAPIVRGGPFRFVRHPNYLVVVGEIAVLPLCFGNWPVALIWTVLNALLLRYRISVEMAALAVREAAPVPTLEDSATL